MITVIVCTGMVMFALWCMATQKASIWRKGQKVFGYFEYNYKGETGSSREYGPMIEIDMVGAIRYREELGAKITFEVYKSSEDEISDIIDQRYHMQNQQHTRRR